MKKLVYSFIALAALVACNKTAIETPALEEGMGSLSVFIAPENVPTKAVTAYTAAKDYEYTANKIQLFIFDSSNALAKRVSLTSGFTQSGSEGATITLADKINKIKNGTYTVYALVNGPDVADAECVNMTTFLTKAFTLTANSTTATTGFVMSGSAEATVTDSNSSCAITVKRYANRVALTKVTNKSAQAITVNAVWLANVVANQTIAGKDAGTSWDNPYSRETNTASPNFAQTNIITASQKSPMDGGLTYSAVGKDLAAGAAYDASSAPHLMYAYANAATSVTAFDAAHIPTSWTATKTRIVIEAVYNGTKYWYPYDLTLADKINTTSTIELLISGPGLDDPQGDPDDLKKGDLAVNITVDGWGVGDDQVLDY